MTSEKSYDYLVGRKYGMLTVTKALPREKGENGKMRPARLLCQCDCGKEVSVKVLSILSGKQKSCGCARTSKRPLKFKASVKVDTSMEDETPIIIKKLHAVWECKNNANSGCVRNEASGLCCRECDKFEGCAIACQNFPSACGAARRNQLKPKVPISNQYQAMETCPNCDKEVTLVWDVRIDGFKAHCPYCGEELMLCCECQHRFKGGAFTDDCDYDSDTNSCRFNRYSYGVKERYTANIRNKLTKRTILEGLAEEASELSKACMKCIRAERMNENYASATPKTAFGNLVEAYGAVCMVANVLGLKAKDDCQKLERWAMRLTEVHHEGEKVSEKD